MDGEEWFEDDEFWEVWAPYIFDTSRLEAAATEIDCRMRLPGGAPPACVLDVCCGSGRHAVELVRRGYRVAGVNRAQPLLDQARRRAAAAQVQLELMQCDARRLEFEGVFDFAINLSTSFGCNWDGAGDMLIARRICAALKCGGTLANEGASKELVARDFQGRDWHRHHDGALTLHERRITHGWELLESCWTLIQGGRIVFTCWSGGASPVCGNQTESDRIAVT